MNDGITFEEFKNYANPDDFWLPIKPEEKEHYDFLLKTVKDTLLSTTSTKSEKGKSLEDLMTYIYKRFVGATVQVDIRTADNQIDHEVEFNDFFIPLFIRDKIGTKFIGESKNHNSSISSREVDNLDGLLTIRDVKLGIFSSYHTFSKLPNSMWVNAEGKRRKLALLSGYKRIIIGFNYTDLQKISDGENFYTMLKNKYESLINELKSDHDEAFGKPSSIELHDSLKFLKDFNIIPEEHFSSYKQNIDKNFGIL